MEKAGPEIRLVFLDVDGVLTDGRITLNREGEETKSFDVRDGLGLKLLMASGIEVVVITGRKSESLTHRAKELGIKEVYQGVAEKGALCRRIVKDRGLEKEAVCAIGDDLPDLPMLLEAGTPIAVADAVQEVKELCDFITSNRGGHGAVREACEWILKSSGRWPTVVDSYKGE